jgi:hydroxyethylthiazole kinase
MCNYKLNYNSIYENETKPLVHFITNYVTINDVANMTLAFGGSPIMAEAIEEIEEITSKCNCLVINFGTLTTYRLDSIYKAIEVANTNNIPVIIDPVGVAASTYRKKIVLDILKKYKISILKGNASEIKALLGLQTLSKGVDSDEKDYEDIDTIGTELAKKYNLIVAITGEIDTICSKKHIAKISGGSKMLTYITGTGCMNSALIAVSLAKNTDPFTSSIYGIATMNKGASMAESSLKEGEGAGTFKVKLIDNIYNGKNISSMDKGKVNIYEVK